MTAAGLWAYTLDNDNSVVEGLGIGDTLTDTFTVTTVDGTAKVVTITINGASDADPNDFDNLAPGPEVVTDPPFVFGTPEGESFAGGGNDGQIIYAGAGDDTVNGTGSGDILYAGSGNDTVKGNGGDDTIYGGSGSDTINGNNDNDTIIGGFGADQLTGSNGNDRFVYLSAADSKANLFDVITDFASGSDKIDLAALGALAFLALTSTSTSVPPHTIAWIYDSATNHTIVYVNPTDRTLSIGSSSLLEIHLQGVVTVESSDFDFVTAAAPAAIAGETINLELLAAAEPDTTVLAMTVDHDPSDAIADSADPIVKTSDLNLYFDVDRRSFDFSRSSFSSFDEERTQSTEATDDNAVIIPENRLLIVPHHAPGTEPAENEFGSAPVLYATTAHDAATQPPYGTIHDASITALTVRSDPAELQSTAHGHAPSHSQGNAGSKTNSNVTPDNQEDLEVPGVPGNHGQPVARSVAHSGDPGHHGAAHSAPDDAGEHGNTPAHGAHTPSPPAHGRSSSAQAAGAPGAGDSFHFKQGNAGSGNSDAIDVAETGHTSASTGLPAHTAGSGGAHAIGWSPPGQSDDHVPSHAANAHHAHASHDLMV
jgi:hypothetical protein